MTEREEISRLARLRADPEKVRIAVRWVTHRGEWRVCISGEGGVSIRHNKSARKALVKAFLDADAMNIKGIDYHMMWTYPHPQKASVSGV